VGFGIGKFCYEVPVFMAHCLNPRNKFSNIDFFEGRYRPPFQWHIDINEGEMDRLRNRTLWLRAGEAERSIRLNSDGTIGPPYFPGVGRYWLVYGKSDPLTLAITSETEILRQFKKTHEDCWESIRQLRAHIP